jgi:hypothetical protein
VPRGTQVARPARSAFAYGTLTPSGGPSQTLRLPSRACCRHLQPRSLSLAVWAAPLSLATTRGIVSFPRSTKMFQFLRFPPLGLCIHPPVTGSPPAGFPHSDIAGSPPAHGSPTLFAVYHVLLRLLTPRHPPFALRSCLVLRRPLRLTSRFDALSSVGNVLARCSLYLAREPFRSLFPRCSPQVRSQWA